MAPGVSGPHAAHPPLLAPRLALQPGKTEAAQPAPSAQLCTPLAHFTLQIQQEKKYGKGNEYAVELGPLDYVKFAEAFDATGAPALGLGMHEVRRGSARNQCAAIGHVTRLRQLPPATTSQRRRRRPRRSGGGTFVHALHTHLLPAC